MKTKLIWVKKLPKETELKKVLAGQTLVLYDSVLPTKILGFQSWLKQFKMTLPLEAGPKLKDFSKFPEHFAEISQKLLGTPKTNLNVLAIGGGTVADFAGFFSSLYQGGVPLAHLPTTWIAAIDAAHTELSGMNVRGLKNRIGARVVPRAVIICEQILKSQSNRRTEDAMGEFVKMALIDGRGWAKKVESKLSLGSQGVEFPLLLWNNLEPLIDSKLKLLDEKKSKNKKVLLQFGLTMGTLIEMEGLSHGLAIAKGLSFAVEWSRQRGYLKRNSAGRVIRFAMSLLPTEAILPPQKLMSRSTFRERIKGDIKLKDDATTLDFVFLKGFGKPMVKEVSIADLEAEAIRQRWVSA